MVNLNKEKASNNSKSRIIKIKAKCIKAITYSKTKLNHHQTKQSPAKDLQSKKSKSTKYKFPTLNPRTTNQKTTLSLLETNRNLRKNNRKSSNRNQNKIKVKIYRIIKTVVIKNSKSKWKVKNHHQMWLNKNGK